MTVLLASDLDRTLVYSAAAMGLGLPVTDPVCVEIHKGREVSFISPRALKRLTELSREVPFVPTTTRSRRQYRRIRFPGVEVEYAVTTNGGTLLVDGEPCEDWTREVDRHLAGVASYTEGEARLATVFDRPWVRKHRNVEDRFTYAVFDVATAPQEWFAELQAAGDELGWVVSVQGRKVYVIPEGLSKEAALAEVARRLGVRTIAAAGDSLLDRGILEYADLALRPAHGELHDIGWTTPGLVVTRQAGGGAAEEIVDAFSELAGGVV